MAKISISLDDELYERVRMAAGDNGVSAWLAEAAAAQLRFDVLQEIADEIAEATGGPITKEEIDEVWPWPRSSSTQAA